jgi:hypothetical protein
MQGDETLDAWIKQISQQRYCKELTKFNYSLDPNVSIELNYITVPDGETRLAIQPIVGSGTFSPTCLVTVSTEWFSGYFKQSPTIEKYLSQLHEDTAIAYWYCLGLVAGLAGSLVNIIFKENDSAVQISSTGTYSPFDTIQIRIESDTGEVTIINAILTVNNFRVN